MDASSTPNQGTESETLEDLPQLGASISRRPQFNKGILLILALGVIGLFGGHQWQFYSWRSAADTQSSLHHC